MKIWEIYKAMRIIMHMTADEMMEEEFLSYFDAETADEGFVDKKDIEYLFEKFCDCLNSKPGKRLVYNDKVNTYDVDNETLKQAIEVIMNAMGEGDNFRDFIGTDYIENMLPTITFFEITIYLYTKK